MIPAELGKDSSLAKPKLLSPHYLMPPVGQEPGGFGAGAGFLWENLKESSMGRHRQPNADLDHAVRFGLQVHVEARYRGKPT